MQSRSSVVAICDGRWNAFKLVSSLRHSPVALLGNLCYPYYKAMCTEFPPQTPRISTETSLARLGVCIGLKRQAKKGIIVTS